MLEIKLKMNSLKDFLMRRKLDVQGLETPMGKRELESIKIQIENLGGGSPSLTRDALEDYFEKRVERKLFKLWNQ